MIVTIGKFRITPHGGGLCWSIEEMTERHVAKSGQHKGQEVGGRWTPTESFPTTLRHALSTVAELLLKDGSVEVNSVEEMQEVVDTIKTDIIAALPTRLTPRGLEDLDEVAKESTG